MKIIKIKKKKNSIYEIILDNNTEFELYDDVILKNDLLLKKEIDEKKLKTILEENNNLECYYKALKFLNIKLRTEKEILTKFKDYSKLSLSYTINRLKNEGYLNNDIYIKSYINDIVNLKMLGQNKIVYDLKKLGFKEDEIYNHLNSIDNDIWLNKINKYIDKKINSNHNLSSLMLKKKITTDLINKGFYKEDIDREFDKFIIEDDEKIYQKEFDKLKNKLSKKYKDNELDYRIKIELLKKGFKKDS